MVLFIYLFGRHEYLYFYCYPDGLLGYLLNELHELIKYVAKLIIAMDSFFFPLWSKFRYFSMQVSSRYQTPA